MTYSGHTGQRSSLGNNSLTLPENGALRLARVEAAQVTEVASRLHQYQIVQNVPVEIAKRAVT